MRITPALLLELGAKTQEDGSSELMMDGYSFVFRLHVDEYVNNGLPMIRLYIGDHPNFHCVTDLEECFGFIAEDFYLHGKNAARQELKDWLNAIE